MVGESFEVSVLPEPESTFNNSLFSYFRRKTSTDRPKSAMAVFRTSKPLTPALADFSGRKSVGERKSSPGNELINLIRRTSVSSEKANESPIKLPDDALFGLTDAEKEHIMKVLAAANRFQITPEQSRR